MINRNHMYKFEGLWKNSTPSIGILTLSNDLNVCKVEIVNIDRCQAKIYYKDGRVYEG